MAGVMADDKMMGGEGVKVGGIDITNLHIADVIPTLADY